jgi:cyclopropane fatty-acyl-phospholipid synthase-like methyltransferase
MLGVDQLAPLDQFHTRGILATADLAATARLETSSRVLDIGCGIGGPARYLASTFGCQVTGVDLSPGFIDAANYLTGRCRVAPLSRSATPSISLSRTRHLMWHSFSTWR